MKWSLRVPLNSLKVHYKKYIETSRENYYVDPGVNNVLFYLYHHFAGSVSPEHVTQIIFLFILYNILRKIG